MSGASSIKKVQLLEDEYRI